MDTCLHAVSNPFFENPTSVNGSAAMRKEDADMSFSPHSDNDAQVLLHSSGAIDAERYLLHPRHLVHEFIRQLGFLASQISAGYDHALHKIITPCSSAPFTAPVEKLG